MKKLLIVSLVSVLLSVVFVHVTASNMEEEPYVFLEQGNTLIDSNLFTQVEDYELYDQGDVVMDDFTMVLENTNYELYLNPDGLALRLVDKGTGFVWSTDLVNEDEYDLSGSWRRRTQSSLFMEYIDEESRALDTPILHRRSSENPDVSYQVNASTILFEVDFTEEEIYLEYEVELTLEGFDVRLDTTSIDEYGDNQITKITFFEFLGTSYEDDIPGYFFVPSGNGALIRFTESSPINSTYRARYYSQDVYNNSGSADTLLNYPVFGSVYGVNQNAFLAVIEEGSEYTSYIYKPPTFQTPFHLQEATFLLRENYVQSISGGDSILIYEDDIKEYSPSISYTFLKDQEANYVGMAEVFKDRLIDHGTLVDLIENNDNIGIHIDTLGKEYEQGLLFKTNYIMTSTDALLRINDVLLSEGLTNIVYSMRGFNKGGYSDRSFTNHKFDRQIGNVNDLSDLEVLFYYDPTVTYTDSSNVPRFTLQNIAQNPAQSSFSRGEYFRYFTDIDAMVDEFDDAYERLDEYGNMLLDGLSNRIDTNKHYTRTEVIALYDELLTERMNMIRPNYYMLDNTKVYFQNVLYHNRSRFFTDSVPFEQILLSGYMPVYGQYLNFSANINIDVLKLIDYGVYPAFLITDQPSYLLSNTMSSELYATYFGNLEDYIVSTYHSVNDALKYTIGEEITNREVIERGIVKVTYSNGVNIYVNYLSDPYADGSIYISPLSYYVER